MSGIHGEERANQHERENENSLRKPLGTVFVGMFSIFLYKKEEGV